MHNYPDLFFKDSPFWTVAPRVKVGFRCVIPKLSSIALDDNLHPPETLAKLMHGVHHYISQMNWSDCYHVVS